MACGKMCVQEQFSLYFKVKMTLNLTFIETTR